MAFRKKALFVNRRTKSVVPKDPLYEFKKSTRGELGRFSVEGEVWRAMRKLLILALALAAIYIFYECKSAWDIFQ